jgi:hypothetical protein
VIPASSLMRAGVSEIVNTNTTDGGGVLHFDLGR